MGANRVVFGLALVGMQIAGYLTMAHLDALPLVCAAGQGCDRVAAHALARGFGIPALSAIPTAAFGAAGFALLALLCGWRAWAGSSRSAMRVQWAVAGVALLVSGWLTYAEAAIIHAWCAWCLASAGVALLIFLTLLAERFLRNALAYWPKGEGRRLAAVLLVVLLVDGIAVFTLREASAAAEPRVSPLIPRGSHQTGDPQAPYIIVGFGDYSCEHCQQADAWLDDVIDRNPKTVGLVFHYFPIADQLNAPPSLAARAAEAAGLQGKFWEMHRLIFKEERKLFQKKGKLSIGWVQKTAKKLHLNTRRFARDLDSPEVSQAIIRREGLGDAFAVKGVPAFFVIPPKGDPLRFDNLPKLQQWAKESGAFRVK